MLASSVVDRGFIGGVMVSVLASSVVDRGFIGGVMVSMLASSPDWVKPKTLKFVFVASPLSTQQHANHYTTDEPTIYMYHIRDKHANHYTTDAVIFLFVYHKIAKYARNYTST
jgi:hypothetical protein